jgi:fucose permease
MLLIGLTCSLLGVLNASFGLHSFARFLLTVVLLGIGATLLQVAGNPMMREVSEKQFFARNLVAGQFVKSIGSLSAPMIPALAARYYGASWQVVFPIYSVALAATLVLVGLAHAEAVQFHPQLPGSARRPFDSIDDSGHFFLRWR